MDVNVTVMMESHHKLPYRNELGSIQGKNIVIHAIWFKVKELRPLVLVYISDDMFKVGGAIFAQEGLRFTLLNLIPQLSNLYGPQLYMFLKLNDSRTLL